MQCSCGFKACKAGKRTRTWTFSACPSSVRNSPTQEPAPPPAAERLRTRFGDRRTRWVPRVRPPGPFRDAIRKRCQRTGLISHYVRDPRSERQECVVAPSPPVWRGPDGAGATCMYTYAVCTWSTRPPLTRAISLLCLTPLPGTSVIFPTRTVWGIPVTRFLISDPEAHIYRTLRLGAREPTTERRNLDTYVPGDDDLSAALGSTVTPPSRPLDQTMASFERLAAGFHALHQRMHNTLYCVVPRPVTGMSATAVWGRLHGASACPCLSALTMLDINVHIYFPLYRTTYKNLFKDTYKAYIRYE